MPAKQGHPLNHLLKQYVWSGFCTDLKARVAAHVLRSNNRKMPRFLEDWVDAGSGKTLQLDENDLWICAQAKERDLTVVTADKDFRMFEVVDSELRILLVQLATL